MNSDKLSSSKHGKASTKRSKSSSSDSSREDSKKVVTHKRKKSRVMIRQRKRRNTSKHKYKKGKNRSSSSDSSTSEDSSTSSSSTDSSSSSEEEKKLKKKKLKRVNSKNVKEAEKNVDDAPSNDIPLEFMDQRKTMAPMTKEEWEKKQSVVRRVYDETTGRNRLIKGDGEVIEEIVSRDRHKQINQQATRGDGEYFQSQLKKC